MTQYLKQGEGWRLGWNPEASDFKGLVGTSEWAVELTGAEFDDFCRLMLQLADTMSHMSLELMDGEAITIEAQSDRLWLEARGFPQAYGMSFIVLQGRRAEGAWSATATPELVQSIQTLKVF